MTVFDLTGEVGKWFELEDGGRIQLKNLTADDLKEIRKQTVKKRVDFKKVDGTPGRFEYEEVDRDLENVLFWEKVIVDWENFFDAKKKPIPCTKENKLLLMGRSQKFIRVVTDFLKVLTDDDAEQAERAEKN